MTSSSPQVGLDSICTDIRSELVALKQIFFTEIAPRADRIGELLTEARQFHTSTAAFYAWVESSVGIRQRQCRTYLAFHRKFQLIQDAAQAERIAINSMEQGLALLAPAKSSEPETRDHMEVLRDTAFQRAGRARGAIRALGQTLTFIREDASEDKPSPVDITDADLAVLTQALQILSKLDAKHDPSAATPPAPTPSPQWSEPDPEPAPDAVSQSTDGDTSLPLGIPPTQWAAAQLEEGRTFYGSWSKLAAAMAPNPKTGKAWSKQALSSAFSSKSQEPDD